MVAIQKTQFPFTKTEFITAVKADRYQLNKHAKVQSYKRDIDESLIKLALLKGEWTEPDPLANPPKVCVHYYTSGGELKIVTSFDLQRQIVYVITVFFIEKRR